MLSSKTTEGRADITDAQHEDSIPLPPQTQSAEGVGYNKHMILPHFLISRIHIHRCSLGWYQVFQINQQDRWKKYDYVCWHLLGIYQQTLTLQMWPVNRNQNVSRAPHKKKKKKKKKNMKKGIWFSSLWFFKFLCICRTLFGVQTGIVCLKLPHGVHYISVNRLFKWA